MMNFLRMAARIASDGHFRMATVPPYHVKDVKRRCRGLKVRLPSEIAPQAEWEEPSWLYAGPVNNKSDLESLKSKLEVKGLVVTPESVLVDYWPGREHRDGNNYIFLRIDRDNQSTPVDKPPTEVD